MRSTELFDKLDVENKTLCTTREEENLRFPPTFRVTQPDGLFHRQSNGFAVVGYAAVPGVGYGFTIKGKATSHRWT